MNIKRSLKNLNSKSDKVRERAAGELAEGRSPAAVEALILALKDDPAYLVRSAAARAMKNFPERPVIAALIEALEDRHSKVSAEASNSLAALGDARAIAPLIELLGPDDFGVSRRASAALMKFGAQAVKPLIETCRNSSDAQREGIVSTLAKLGGVAVRPLIEALASGDRSVRECAAKALGRIGDRAAVVPLLALLEDDDPRVVAAAAEALGELREPQSLDALLELLESEQAEVRQAATTSLGKLNPEAVTPLLAKLADEREHVRLSAAAALAALGNEAVEQRVIEGAYSEPDWQARQAMVSCLGRIERDDAFESLLAALGDEDFRVRKTALITVGNVTRQLKPHHRARRVERITEMLFDPAEPALRTAARALVSIGEETTSEPIIRALGSENVQIRLATAGALRDYFHNQTTPLPTRGWFKMVPTAHGIEVPGSTRMVVDSLIEHAADPHEGVRQAAAEALVSVTEALRLDQSYRLRGVGLSAKDDGQTAFREAIKEAVAQRVESATPQAEPPPRYADFTFYRDKRKPENRVLEAEPLCADRWYELEVAVRVEPTGISPADGKPRPIRQPLQKGDIVLLVTAESKSFEIKERVRPLTLPSSGDSPPDKCAVFKVRPLSRSTSEKDLARIAIRIFYKLNLLEAVTIRAEVADEEDGEGSQLGLSKSISYLHQKFLKQQYSDFDDLAPRELHIDVEKPGNNFALTFTLIDHRGNNLALTGSTDLTPVDLEDMLLRAREIFETLSLSKTFVQGVEGKLGEWRDGLRALACHGNSCWKTLFKQDVQGSLFLIGKFLEENPPEEDGIIQVTIHKEARQFIFPWSLLYPKAVPEQKYLLPETRDFWGWRCVIEQRIGEATSDTDVPVWLDGKLNLAFMLWEEFRNAKDQEQLMSDLVSRSAQMLEVSAPPITKKEDFTKLINNLDAQILYFYTHGHTRLHQGDIGYGKLLQSFIKRYESLEADNPAREILKSTYDAIKGDEGEKFQQDESWIELSQGRIHYSELLDIVDLSTQPLVFLNMCESAQITPSISHGFIDFFLNRRARAVIGTECMMTVEFAHPFAKSVLEGLLAGAPLGQVMLDARREFINRKNPLGLAYTLFGSAMLCFKPPRFKKSAGGDTAAGAELSNEQNPKREKDKKS
jgi:HEAT repeat protein